MSQQNKPYHILVIEDNPGDFILLKEFLLLSKLPVEKIIHAVNMDAAISLVNETIFDIAFLDLTLPDSKGIDSVITLNRLLPKTPIVVLSGLSTIEIAIKSIAIGAQDYLVKGEFDEKILAKSFQYSIERNAAKEKLRKSNELYEYVNKATQDTIWEWDYLAKEGLWGNGIIKTFGYSKDKLKYDENWIEEYIHPADKEHLTHNIESSIISGNENWQEEYRFLCADGTYKEVFDRGYILFDERLKPYRMIGAMTDITEKRALERELVEIQLYQQKLITETAIDAQESERTMLGRELHDNINQILASAKMYICLAQTRKEETETFMAESLKLLESAMEEIRKLSKTLVAPSLGALGLKEVVQELVEEVNFFKGVQVELNYNYTFKKALNKKIDLMLYRVIQEQLNNICKYAAAEQANISINTCADQVFLSIADNGVGFDPKLQAKGIGLKNIKNRVAFYNGQMKLITAPAAGCTLEIKIPIKDEYFE